MAMDMFIKIGDLKGESRDKTHAGEIDVLAWSWGMSNSGSAHMGGGAGSGKVNVQDISLTKYIDASSNALIDAACTGKHFDTATLTVRKAGGTPLEYVVITLYEVMVTSVSTGGSGGEDRLTENVSLNFAKFKFSYQPQKADGSKDGGTKDVTYDIAQNTKEG
jgi:type VI secretion system secreted protein Hcp